MSPIRHLLALAVAFALAACGAAPDIERKSVAAPLQQVAQALATIDTRPEDAEIALPPGTVTRGAGNIIQWNIPWGSTVAAQLQIVLVPIDGGKRTQVVATYAPADLTDEMKKVPALADPAILRQFLHAALEAQLGALDGSANANQRADLARKARQQLASAVLAVNGRGYTGADPDAGATAATSDAGTQTAATTETAPPAPAGDPDAAGSEASEKAKKEEAARNSPARFSTPMFDASPMIGSTDGKEETAEGEAAAETQG